MNDQNLKLLIIDENPVRAAIFEDGLREAGFARVHVVRETLGLMRRIAEIDPDVVFIGLENPNRDVLEQMFQVSRSVRRPIAIFVDRSDTAATEAAIDAGVSAYVVDGLRKERVKPILDVTIRRFNAFNRLREELDRTKQALEDRKVVDKAKGILMKTHNLTEEEAYSLLRKTAMNESRRVAEIAAALVVASKLLR